MDQEERGKCWSKIVAKAWADEEFKKRLLSDPAGVLKEEGMNIPADLTFKAFENNDKVVHLVIPGMPKDLEQSSWGEERMAAACHCCE